MALGLLVGLTGVVSRDALEKAVLARAPKGTEEMNRKALQAGFAAAEGIESLGWMNFIETVGQKSLTPASKPCRL